VFKGSLENKRWKRRDALLPGNIVESFRLLRCNSGGWKRVRPIYTTQDIYNIVDTKFLGDILDKLAFW
jgi:hypothetical protein